MQVVSRCPSDANADHLTESLCDEDHRAQKPDLLARRRRLLVRPLSELASALEVPELEMTPTHLVVEPGALERRLRHRQTHVPAATQHQERIGSSNRPWLSRQYTGLISSGVTKTSADPCTNIYSPPSIAKGPWLLPRSTPSFPLLPFVNLSLGPFSPLHRHHSPVSGASRLTYFNI